MTTKVNIEAVGNAVNEHTQDPVPDTPVPGPFRAEPLLEDAPNPLATLKAKLAVVRDELYTDLEVPRWDVPPPDGRGMGLKVFVRYKPVAPSAAQRTNERFQKSGVPDWETQANAEILHDNCLGVYAMLPGDDTRYSLRDGDPTGQWTTMDEHLAVMLGPAICPQPWTGVSVCRALYCTDGDVTVATLQLADWSAQASEKAEKGFPRP